jgi:hypothetical protein
LITYENPFGFSTHFTFAIYVPAYATNHTQTRCQAYGGGKVTEEADADR